MNKKFTTKNLVMAGVLTALSVILTRLFSVQLTESMRIGIGPLPIFMVGIAFGPLLGAISGLGADLIGFMINAGGQFHLGFTMSSILTGLIPGLMACYFLKKKKNLNLTIILSIVLVYGVVHLILNSYWLNGLYGTPFTTLVAARATKVVIEAVVVGIILEILMRRFIKYSFGEEGTF